MKNLTKTLILLLFSVVVSFAQNAEMTNEAKLLYNEGNSLRKSGNYSGAVAKYDEAAAISQDYRIYYQKSVALKKQRNYEEAEVALLKCVELNPEFGLAYNGLGTTYYALGKFQEAADNFEKFATFTDKKSEQKKAKKYSCLAYTKLGEDAKKEKENSKAINYLEKAIGNSNYDSAYLLLAEIYEEQGEHQKALDAANNALKYRGKKSKITKGAVNYYKGLALKGLGDKVKAKKSFQVALNDKVYKQNAKYELDNLNR